MRNLASGSPAIEPALSVDYDQLIKVWERSVRATHYFLTETDILFYRDLIYTRYFDLVRLNCIRNTSGKIVAFIGTKDQKIEMLFVDPSSRGRGLGKQLVNFALNELDVKYVDVNEQNDQAVGFYYALGCRLLKRVPVDGMGKPYPILHLGW